MYLSIPGSAPSYLYTMLNYCPVRMMLQKCFPFVFVTKPSGFSGDPLCIASLRLLKETGYASLPFLASILSFRRARWFGRRWLGLLWCRLFFRKGLPDGLFLGHCAWLVKGIESVLATYQDSHPRP